MATTKAKHSNDVAKFNHECVELLARKRAQNEERLAKELRAVHRVMFDTYRQDDRVDFEYLVRTLKTMKKQHAGRMREAAEWVLWDVETAFFGLTLDDEDC